MTLLQSILPFFEIKVVVILSVVATLSQVVSAKTVPFFLKRLARLDKEISVKPISLRANLLGSLGGLFFFLGIYSKSPFLMSEGPSSFLDELNFLRFVYISFFFQYLTLVSWIDFRTRLIPDELSLTMIVLSPIAAWLHPELSIRESLLGVLLGGGFIYVVAWLYFLVRKREGIGFGDAKLLAAIGGWLGYQSVFPTVLLGAILGSIIGCFVLIAKNKLRLEAELPFAPFLSFAAICCYIYSDIIFMML